MDSIEKLTELFTKFPGIGPRQARRFVQYLLTVSPVIRGEIADLVKRLGAETKQCTMCMRWFVKDNKADCSICRDTHRDSSILFVVEKDADIDNVEKSNFKGLYFVLGGTIPLASDEPTKYVRMKELQKRMKDVQEIILGLSATTEGDHTRLIVSEILRDSGKKISSLGRGLSTGSELEYADPDTIAQALGNRH